MDMVIKASASSVIIPFYVYVWTMDRWNHHILYLLLLSIVVRYSDCKSIMTVGTSTSVTYIMGSKPVVVLESGSAGYAMSLDCGNATIIVTNTMAESGPVLVWVANYFDSNYTVLGTENVTCSLELGQDGDLQLLLNRTEEKSQVLVWNTGTEGKGAQSLEIQDSGNLVLINSSNGTVWQSFDYPTNLLLDSQNLTKGMKLVAPDASGYHSGGTYFMELEDGDLRLYAIIDDDGNKTLYWSLNKSIGNQIHADLSQVEYAALFQGGVGLFAADSSVVLSTSSQSSQSSYSNLFGRLNEDASFIVYLLFEGQFWNTNYAALDSNCRNPKACGNYGICSMNSSQNTAHCTCPAHFNPLNSSDLTQGCTPPQFPRCGGNVELWQLNGNGYSYFSSYVSSAVNMSLNQCKQSCLQDCSCLAVFMNLETPSACFFIENDVLTIMETSDVNQLMFLRVDADSIGQSTPVLPTSRPPTNHKKGVSATAVGLGTAGTVFLLSIIVVLVMIWRRRKDQLKEGENFLNKLPVLPPRFSYKELQIATNGFNQKIGTGGFGCVYEGVLGGKARVAVKRLEGGTQGERQFEAEVASVGSIDHINLVRLRGFCMEGEHRLLVYEFMEGGSLDMYIARDCVIPSLPTLDWQARYEIALAVARGLAYLHEGTSRKILHCDIKPANILLDSKLVAKISDFGLCKIMYRDMQSYTMTNMRGTRGYLAPEWLLNLPVSEKSDVYSYGMVLLELVSGRKISDLDVSDEICNDLPSRASSALMNNCIADFLDDRLAAVTPGQQVYTLVQVSLCCTQAVAASRPKMSTVVKMLEGAIEVLPELSPDAITLVH